MEFKYNKDCIDGYDDKEMSGSIFIDDDITFSTNCYFNNGEIKKIIKVMEASKKNTPKDIIEFRDTGNFIEITKNKKYHGSIEKNNYNVCVGINNTIDNLKIISKKIDEIKLS